MPASIEPKAKGRRKSGLGALVVLLLIFLLPTTLWWVTRTPDVLATGRDFQAALAANRDADGEILIVKASSDFCSVCRAMNRTFGDEDVVAWIETHGSAMELDVNAAAEDAEALGVRGLPTLVVFRGGEEIGRRIGFAGPTEFTSWLEGVVQ